MMSWDDIKEVVSTSHQELLQTEIIDSKQPYGNLKYISSYQ